MSIVSVTRVWSGETWEDEKDGSRQYQELYRVQSDDPDESAYNVRFNAGLPLPWSSYPDDGAAICTGRSARRVDATRLLWEVTVNYEWKPEDEDDEENPLLKDPEIEWESSLFTKAAIKDRDGDAITNSAGDYFDPPPEDEVVRWNVVIQFNADDIPAFIRQFAGAINESAISIEGEVVAAEHARIVGLKISKWQTENDVEFRTVTLALEVRDDDDDNFDLELLDQGLRVKVGGLLQDVMIEPEGGGTPKRASAPVLLNGSGGILSDPSPTTAVFLTFQNKRLMDFTIFPGID